MNCDKIFGYWDLYEYLNEANEVELPQYPYLFLEKLNKLFFFH